MSSPGPGTAKRKNAAHAFSAGAVCLLALVVIYRPVGSGMLYGLGESTAVALLLLAAGPLWVAGRALAGQVTVHLGGATLAFGVFLLAALVSVARTEDRFAGLQWWLYAATCGLTGLLVLQMAEGERLRRFFLSCLVAAGAAAAAYALWHAALYEPALRAWFRSAPELFQAVSGASASGMDELGARAATGRAYGSFITPNQLAGFLALVAVPLMAVLIAARGRRLILAAAMVVVLVALGLTRSNGGWIGFGAGLAVFAGGALLGRRRLLRVLIPLAVVTVVLAFLLASLSSPSLGARLGYWRTSARMAVERPFFGVGPGAWANWYAILKAPEFEETRAAHSAYMQLWAETGAIGVGLFLLAWVLLLRRGVGALRRPAEEAEEGPMTEQGLLAAGLVLAAVAFAFDFVHVGTFFPPGQGVPAWPRRAPHLPYLLVYAVWAATFVASFRSACAGTRLVGWGLAGGLAAFLVHSGGEFTLIVPAIAGSAAVAAALLYGRCGPPLRVVAAGPAGRAMAVIAAACALTLFGALAAPRVLVWSRSLQAAERARISALVPALRGGAAAEEDVTALYRRACAALPWDAGAYRALADWLMQAGRPADAAQAMERAVRLSPLHSGYWTTLGSARLAAGDAPGAIAAYRRAAALYPSLPAAWYAYGAAIADAGGSERDACDAYRRALELLPRQFHARNRVPGPVLELVRFASGLSGRPARRVLLDMWRGSWDASGGQPAWDALPERQQLALALRGTGVNPAEAERGDGWELGALWDAAGAQAHVGLLLSVGQELSTYQGTSGTAPGGTERERLARLVAGLKGGAELLREWDALDWPHRQARLWSVAAERLWLWALKEKVRRCAGGEAVLVAIPGAAAGARRATCPTM